MLYEGIIQLIILIWMLTYFRRGRAPWYFLLIVVCKWLCTFCCVLYLAKDAYYCDTISRYFLVNKELFRRLVFLPVHRDTLIRGMNAGAAGFYFFSVMFAIVFTDRDRAGKLAKLTAGVWFLLQLLVCDPSVYGLIYRLCYPTLMDAHTFHQVEEGLNTVFFVGNLALLLFSAVGMLVYAARRTTLRALRIQNLPVAIGCAVLLPFNIPLLLMLPRTLTRVSLAANGFVTYNSLPLGNAEGLYIGVMLVDAAAIAIIAFFIVWRLRLARKMANDQLAITQRIDAANSTSKAFCHYLKNELLAFSAELELLTLPLDESSKTLQHLQQRCENLYIRLDEMYHSTRQGTLHLQPTRLQEPLQEALHRLENILQGYEISLPRENPKLMLDPSYFAICLEDLLRNAVEASQNLPPERHKIDITVEREPGFYMISLRDYGAGISPTVLPKLFTPFTSTKPIQTNWGISLSLIYRIIRAHGGSINMNNASTQGAVVHMLLPRINEDA